MTEFNMKCFLKSVGFCACLLVGCATPYSKNSILGGFQETEIAPALYRVTFTGNAYTSLDRVRLYTLLRCANLTLEKGCDYFVEVSPERMTHSSPTLQTNPHATIGTPGAYAVYLVVELFKGERPAGLTDARDARAVKAQIEAALGQ